jgi:shikimate 5-dehydrogenase
MMRQTDNTVTASDGRYPPAAHPTIYFIGVTTGRSMIMRVFPAWAEHLGFGDCQITGIDLALHDRPERYRQVVEFIKADPLSLGALVTSHKIDLLAASRDLFDGLDDFAALLGEVSCISKHKGKLLGGAKDPVTSGLALEGFLPTGYWQRTGADVFIMGAGGSSVALSSYLVRGGKGDSPQPTFGRCRPERPGGGHHARMVVAQMGTVPFSPAGADRPARIFVSNRSQGRLEEMQKIHRQMGVDVPVEYFHTPRPQDNDAVLSRIAPGSLVANATGLGKDAPGSPLSDAAVFPEGGFAWDFNYRGDLVFLQQARAQAAARRLTVVDGWLYFIHGWTSVIAEVFHRDIPARGPVFEQLCRIAEGAR